MQLIYILLIGIVVYYLVTRLFENYSTQEDFDPSLVPVSSIVTLAKVAQKLVDGGGTLTNPGNLTVTGNSTVGGNFMVNGNSTVGGNFVANNIVIKNAGAEWGANLNLTAGTKEDAYINFNQKDGTTRNTFIMGTKNNLIIGSNTSIYGNGTAGVGALNITQPNPKGVATNNIGINAGGTDIITTGIVNAGGLTVTGDNIRFTKPDSIANGVNTITNTGGSNIISMASNVLACDCVIGTGQGNKPGSGQKVNFGWDGWGTTIHVSGNIDTDNNIQAKGFISAIGNLTVGGIVTIHNSAAWDYIYYGPHGIDEKGGRFLQISGGGWSDANDPTTADNNGWVSWDGGSTELISKSKWNCPGSGLWTISWWIKSASGNFILFNKTQKTVISMDYGTTTVSINANDIIHITNGGVNANSIDTGGYGYWKLKKLVNFN
jgi:hypothetical protein